MTYLLLIFEFIKTGLFAIGGGLATLPYLNEMADKHPWFDRAMVADMIAISESTPGPIGINMATYAGFTAAGVGGGLVASLALILPSVIIVTLISRFLKNFADNRFVKAAFYGLRPAVTALIASAGLGVAALTVIDPSRLPEIWRIFNLKELLLFAVLFVFTRIYKKTQPVHLIGAAAVIGVFFQI